VVFPGQARPDIDALTQQIQSALISGEFFVAEDLGLPRLQVTPADAELDHDWHEFESIECCDDDCDDPVGRDIRDFVAALKAACVC